MSNTLFPTTQGEGTWIENRIIMVVSVGKCDNAIIICIYNNNR